MGRASEGKKLGNTKKRKPAHLEREKLTENIGPYLIGVVEEITHGITTRKVLTITKGTTRGRFTEKYFPNLSLWEVGDLIALEQRTDGEQVPWELENLGKRGTYVAESARRAYLIGNGSKFPKEVQQVEGVIEAQGQELIRKEIERLEQADKLVAPDDPEFSQKFKHGECRVDLRAAPDIHVITIDPRTARDHDDALHARRVTIDGKEYIEVGVHIADVSHFVPMKKEIESDVLFDGRALARNAQERGFTLYTPHRAYPMLPPILSEQLCSLKEGQDRLTFSTIFHVDEETGRVENVWQGECVIRSERHFTYERAQELYDSSTTTTPEDKELQEGLRILTAQGQKFRKERDARGQISFAEREELEIDRTERGDEIVGVKKNLEMHKVVADWMIRANEAMATMMMNKCKEEPDHFFGFFRFHEPPSLRDIYDIAKIYNCDDVIVRIEGHIRASLGGDLDTPEEVHAPVINEVVLELLKFADTLEVSRVREESVQNSVAEAAAHNEPHMLLGATPEETEAKIRARLEYLRDEDRRGLRRRVMSLFSKAKYTTDPQTHFGLSKKPYTAGTSPIRRDVDIIVQHLLKAGLVNIPLTSTTQEELTQRAEHLNVREKVIDDAERATKGMWAVDFLLKKITPEQPTIEIDDAWIVRVPGVDEGDDPSLYVRMRLPQTAIVMTFPVAVQDFRNLPKTTEERRDLRNAKIAVRVVGGDVERGTLKLELVSITDATGVKRERIKPELAAAMKEYYLDRLLKFNQDFKEILLTNSSLARELRNLTARIEQIAPSTPARIVQEIGRDVESLWVGLHFNTGRPPQLSPRSNEPQTSADIQSLSEVEREVAEEMERRLFVIRALKKRVATDKDSEQ